jgi:hypothetical protein
MKKILISAYLLVAVVFVSAQRINKISVSNKGSNTTVSVLLSENVMINVNQDGNIVEWGVDKYADRGATNNAYRKLTPYEGRVEYYTDKVITPDGFILAADGYEDFTRAIKRKLILEIAKN